MKKLFTIFILLLIGLVSFGQATQKIRNNLRIMDDLTVDSTLIISLLSTSTTTVATFTSTGKVDTLETSDISTITISTLTAVHFETTDDIEVADDILLADGSVVGITGNEIITFNAVGSINITGATFDVDGAASASSYASDGAITAVGDVYTVAWTDYGATSTVVGWEDTPTTNIWYKKVGNLVYVNFNIAGTSNATNITFTLPYTNNGSTNASIRVAIRVKDNNITRTIPGLLALSPNSNTVNVFLDMASSNLFTDSGGKSTEGQFWYEAQ